MKRMFLIQYIKKMIIVFVYIYMCLFVFVCGIWACDIFYLGDILCLHFPKRKDRFRIFLIFTYLCLKRCFFVFRFVCFYGVLEYNGELPILSTSFTTSSFNWFCFILFVHFVRFIFLKKKNVKRQGKWDHGVKLISRQNSTQEMPQI